MTLCIVSQNQLDTAVIAGEAERTGNGFTWHGFEVEVGEDE